MRGVPECGSQLNTPSPHFIINWVLGNTLGDMGIDTFSVLSFIYSHANAILYGVSQGLQPLWGQAFGRKDKLELRSDFRTGMKINLIFSNVIYILLVLFRVPAVTLFNSDLALVEMASKALPVFALLFSLYQSIQFLPPIFILSNRR